MTAARQSKQIPVSLVGEAECTDTANTQQYMTYDMA
jgi:hypothetical protein